MSIEESLKKPTEKIAKKFVSPTIFFKLIDQELILWDYIAHQQYSIEPAYLARLLAWEQHKISDTVAAEDAKIDQELEEAGILQTTSFPVKHWGWDVLSHIFHYGTRDIFEAPENAAEANQNYIDACEDIADDKPVLFTEKPGPRVILPAPNLALLNQPLWQVLSTRETSRHFYGQDISLEKFSTLLYASFGRLEENWSHMEKLGVSYYGYRRTSASGGSLQTCDAYIIALKVTGLEPGVYHYRPQDHQLTLIQAGQFQSKMGYLMSGQYFAENLSIGVFLAARFDKSWWKYPHSRSYRVVTIDAGHLSQTFQLVATALGLNTWVSGAFRDSKVDEVLQLSTPEESPLFFMGAGIGAKEPLSPDMVQQLHAQK